MPAYLLPPLQEAARLQWYELGDLLSVRVRVRARVRARVRVRLRLRLRVRVRIRVRVRVIGDLGPAAHRQVGDGVGERQRGVCARLVRVRARARARARVEVRVRVRVRDRVRCVFTPARPTCRRRA